MAKSAPPQTDRSATPGINDPALSEQDRTEIAELTNIVDRRVARRIRSQRLKSGMTLQALAQDIGVAFQQAHKYERGQSRVSAGRLFHIARVLGAPITYFFQSEDEANASEQYPVKDRADAAPPSLVGPGFVGDQRGATATLFAVMLTALLGFAGLGIDVGVWYALVRLSQSAADSAALSGAIELANGKGVYDSGGNSVGCVSACSFPTDTQTKAMYAGTNNLPSGAATLSIDSRSSGSAPNGCTDPAANALCVNNPPTLGPYAGNGNYVEVILAEPSLSLFPAFVGYSTAPVIRTRAVAGLTQILPSCFVALGYPYGQGNTLSLAGGGNNVNLSIPNCAFVSASTSPASADADASIYLNGNITITAGAVNTSGGYVIKGNSASVTPPIVPNITPQFADPYCDATQATAACPTAGPQITLSSYPWSPSPPTGTAGPNLGCADQTWPMPLKPGWYGGVCATGNTAPMRFSSGTVTLCPGVYYLDGETTSGSTKGAALIISNNGTTVALADVTNLAALGCPTTYPNGTSITSTNAGVSFIASCSTAGCHSGGGISLGGQGSDTPTVNLTTPSVSPKGSPPTPGPPSTPSIDYIPSQILFHQVFDRADTARGSSFGTVLGTGVNGVIHVPATPITLSGGTSFGSCVELIAAAFVFSGGATLGRVNTCNLQTDKATIISLVE